MFDILTVDLASRFSAATHVYVTDVKTTVLRQFDSWGPSAHAFVEDIATHAASHEVDVLLVEDVPYGISRQAMVKPVLRLQGMLISACIRHNTLDRLLFVNPATWQRDMGVWGKGPDGAIAAAAELGYTPPSFTLTARTPAQIRKARSDYADAYLMAVWAGTRDEDLRGISGVQEPSI